MPHIPMAISVAPLLLLLPAFFGALMQPCMGDEVLLSGSRLQSRQSLQNGNYRLTMQEDCNLVLYEYNNPLWATGTDRRGNGCYVTMQNDGNLVVCSTNGAVWASNTQRGAGNYVLVLQRDRNVVIYGGNLWASDTYVGVGRKVDAGRAGDGVHGAVVVVNSKGESIGSKIEMVTKKLYANGLIYGVAWEE